MSVFCTKLKYISQINRTFIKVHWLKVPLCLQENMQHYAFLKYQSFFIYTYNFLSSVDRRYGGDVKPKHNLKQVAITQVWRYQESDCKFFHGIISCILMMFL